MNALQILSPIFLVIVLGAWLCRRGHYSAEFFRDANRLTYAIGLPAMLFREVAMAPLRGSRTAPTTVVLLGAALAAGLVAALLARARRLSAPRTAALISCAFRGNIAYAGLPIVMFALPFFPSGETAWGATAALCLALMTLINNVACILLCQVLTHRSADQRRALLRSIALNPLILASAGGGIVALSGLTLPPFALRTLQVIGNMALPMARLGLGASLDFAKLRDGALGWAAVAALLKTLFSPLIGWGLARAMGLGPEETLIALIYLSCPTAVSMYIMARPLGADEPLTGAAIALSTLVSAVPLTLSLILFAP